MQTAESCRHSVISLSLSLCMRKIFMNVNNKCILHTVLLWHAKHISEHNNSRIMLGKPRILVFCRYHTNEQLLDACIWENILFQLKWNEKNFRNTICHTQMQTGKLKIITRRQPKTIKRNKMYNFIHIHIPLAMISLKRHLWFLDSFLFNFTMWNSWPQKFISVLIEQMLWRCC